MINKRNLYQVLQAEKPKETVEFNKDDIVVIRRDDVDVLYKFCNFSLSGEQVVVKTISPSRSMLKVQNVKDLRKPTEKEKYLMPYGQ